MGSLAAGPFVELAQIPSLHGLVPASREQQLAVGTERQAGDQAEVAAEVTNQLPAAAVPNFHGAVFARRGEPPALVIGTERRGPDFAGLPRQNLHVLGLQIPNLDRILLTSGDQPLAVRAEPERHARH